MKDKILNEITIFCEECVSKDCCPENDCVLYRIESIVNKKIYTVEIEETLSKVVDVEADSKQDALTTVEEKYKSEEIVLDDGCFVDYNINIVD